MIRTVRWLISVALRWGGVTAAERTLRVATSTLPDRVNRAQTQVFNISGSTTVYVRGSNCRVTVTRGDARRVIVEANLVRAFGLDLVAEQDDAGVYIVARQKPVVGKLSRAEFSITVPEETHLVFRLTPGDVVLNDLNGMLELPASVLAQPALAPAEPPA
ncbi:MAG: hypothetical protein GX613_03830 [Chloroflexi bacterium]|jgi:hypothetical protein|nr:hypothetical protein [Chloroflexota bacterium]